MAPGPMQIVIIILLVMVIFGAGRIPAIMENVAKGINSFKKGLKDEDQKISSQSKTSDVPSSEASGAQEQEAAPKNKDGKES